MKGIHSRFVLSALSLMLTLLLSTTALLAQTQEAQTKQTEPTQMQTIDKEKLEEARKESREASEVLNEIMKTPDKSIPRELLQRAEAIAVFPNVVKAAFIVGGQGGDGVISRRSQTGWGPPVFFKIRGGSIGPQIGAESTDYVLLFMNEGALKGLVEDEFEIGGEISVSAGPVGRTASATTNVTLDAGILSYSRSKGAFIGASLKGSKISPQNEMNRAILGSEAKEILSGAKMVDTAKLPEGIMTFIQTLNNHTKGVTSQNISNGATVAAQKAANKLIVEGRDERRRMRR
ncbi:MAG TPA: lipid-binding SYLF domain-containing protein [Blastocatellia bacterium]|nr:lipid-binding SYLF domain-containing protein [Blastocatellia bacterium]